MVRAVAAEGASWLQLRKVARKKHKKQKKKGGRRGQ